MSEASPQFFVPHAADAESVWQSTKKFMNDQGYSILDRRIYCIGYSHDGKKYFDVVGKVNPLLQEPILVIMDAGTTFLCCTANRGVLRGAPVMVGKSWDTNATDFAPG